MERMHYIDSEDRLVIETLYDAEPALVQAAQAREAPEKFTIGSGGTAMPLACVIPVEHVVTLRNMGYDLLSPDPAEWRRALVYIQQNQHLFMAMEKTVFSVKKPKWE